MSEERKHEQHPDNERRMGQEAAPTDERRVGERRSSERLIADRLTNNAGERVDEIYGGRGPYLSRELTSDEIAALSKMSPGCMVVEAGVLPSEALYGFAAWLTCRDEEVCIGASNECGIVAELVQRYCESQGFAPPRSEIYPDNLKTAPSS